MEIKTDVKTKKKKKRKQVEDKHYWKWQSEMRESLFFFVALFVIL